jgi:hypothetical protein
MVHFLERFHRGFFRLCFLFKACALQGEEIGNTLQGEGICNALQGEGICNTLQGR